MVKLMGFVDIACGLIISAFLLGFNVPLEIGLVFLILAILKGLFSMISL